ncbi:nuclease SbcCD subunit C [Leptidea sinapis]|uniref:nuclease SbcCD subunit C n=1 Tax=Leptidea sinapis TaxID=189913 RepID=UPI00212188FE|nr:nuclease SbcCD subunit C [Leptidea sinapis]
MESNGDISLEDAEMNEHEGEKVVTMIDVLQEQAEFEEDANAVLGASDDKECTYNKGYIKRQAVYACMTCCAEAKNDPSKRAGVCLACCLTCHENHELVELYTKRNFRCDCGNQKFYSYPCQLTPNKKDLNEENNYNQNFSGVYCVCHRPYPDPESSIDDEMIQCIVCEDWLHVSHLEATVPGNDIYSEMICKRCMEKNSFLHDYSDLAVNNETDFVDVVNKSDLISSVCNEESNNIPKENSTMIGEDIALNNSKLNTDSEAETEEHKNDTTDLQNIYHECEELPHQTNNIICESQKADQMEDEPDKDLNNDNMSKVTDKTLLETHNTDKIEKESDKDLPGIQKTCRVDGIDQIMETDKVLPKNQNTDKIEEVTHKVVPENQNTDKIDLNKDGIDQITRETQNTDKIQEENDKVLLQTHCADKIDEEKSKEPVGEDKIHNELNKTIPEIKGEDKLQDDNKMSLELQVDVNINKDVNNAINDTNSINESMNNTKDENISTLTTNNISSELEDPSLKIIDDKDVNDPHPLDIQKELLTEETPNKEEVQCSKLENNTIVMDSKSEQCEKQPMSIEEIEKMEEDNLLKDPEDHDMTMDIGSKKNENSGEIQANNIPNMLSTKSSDEAPEKSEGTPNNIEVNEKELEETPQNIDNKTVIEDKSGIMDGCSLVNPTDSSKIDDVSETNQKNDSKRKIEDSEDGLTIKKSKLNCVRPNGVKMKYKGATFWPSNFRQKLCTCSECISMYKDLSVLFLIDLEDTVTAYENLGKEKSNGRPSTQYEKGLEALSSLDRVQQINALTEYNKMRDKLLNFLKSFKERKEVVKEEDIKAFFAGMKPKREPDGVYFCR